MKKIRQTPFTLAMGASLLPFFAPAAQAEINPFALTELNAGYMQIAQATPATPAPAEGKAKEGKCGEGKCGAAMMKEHQAADKKAVEGKCAGNKTGGESGKQADGNCGANKK